MLTTRVVVRESDGLNEAVHTRHVLQPNPIEPVSGARGIVIDATNEAKMNDLLGELATFVARERPFVQSITIDFHIAG